MATTPGGYPYPLGTDLVVNGDNAIRALAEQLDVGIMTRRFSGAAAQTLTPAFAPVKFDTQIYDALPGLITYADATARFQFTKSGIVELSGVVNVTGTTAAWWMLQLVHYRPSTQVSTPLRIRTGAAQVSSLEITGQIFVTALDCLEIQGRAAVNSGVQANDSNVPATYVTARYLQRRAT